VLSLVASLAHGQSDSGVTARPAPTGDDAASVAARVKALEERLESLWSLRQGPEIMNLDTVDRLGTRLLALEQRMADVEAATGVRDARSHGHDGTFQVAVAALLLERADFAADPGGLVALRRMVEATAWPEGLRAKADQLLAQWKAHDQARAGGDAASVAKEGATLAQVRDELVFVASNWVASMVMSGGHDHAMAGGAHADHSPHHGGQVGMKGDTHVELVSEGGGAWRVFLSDMFRQPLQVGGFAGTVVIFPDAQDERTLELHEDGDTSMTAAGAPAGRSPVDARVNITPPSGEPFFIDFQYATEGASGGTMAHPPGCPMLSMQGGEPPPVPPAQAAAPPPVRRDLPR
jgi:hypothetical protein